MKLWGFHNHPLPYAHVLPPSFSIFSWGRVDGDADSDDESDDRSRRRLQRRRLRQSTATHLEWATSSPSSPRHTSAAARASGLTIFCCIMGVWQGVTMDSLKYPPGPPCPALLCPAGRPPLKWHYRRFRAGSPTGRAPYDRLQLHWTPRTVRSCASLNYKGRIYTHYFWA
jgi:hypothetical protein